MTRSSITGRHVGIALLVGLLVLAPGCAALGGSGPSTNGTDGTETTSPVTTAGNQTAGGDGHSHSHNFDGPDGDAPPSGSATGQMSVVINGTVLDTANAENLSAFRFEDGGDGTWHRGNETVTVAEALSSLGVSATSDRVAYEGTTYYADAENTSINVRVNGKPVDPEQYELQDGDAVWVTVETGDMNASTPGAYISHDDQHIHGDIEFVVNGEEVDFSEAKYQSGHRHFHFEGGQADPWHAHSWSITLEYAMATLPGIDVTSNSVTYDNTTYRQSDAGTSVTVKVNGESVTPSEYFLKDGDSVRIVVETETSE